MKLSILIATVGRREKQFKKLVRELNRQANKFPGKIEIVAYWNNGELPIGEIRKRLIDNARGEYVCFVDDDDWVADYYCEEIMRNLGEDYVGFEVKLFNNGKEMPRVLHSLRYPEWKQDEDGYYRDITHLNPIKRSIAIQGAFTLSGAGEDFAWVQTIRNLVKTENYIDRVMYYYYHDAQGTTFNAVARLDNKVYHRPDIKYKNFRYIGDKIISRGDSR